VLSGGALESFAACPVRWLVESQLQPRELAPDPEPLVKGSFMHDVLERVIGGLGGPLTPAALPEAERRLGELTAEVPDGLAPGRPDAVRRALLAGIEADLRRYLRHEASDGCTFVPEAVELRFGFDDGEEASLPPLVLDGDVRVRGVIDRIDVAPGTRQAIVRDYKSGSGRPERAGARWREERQMQVALYMLAARRLLALEPVAGFYQPLGGRDLRARGVYRAGTDVGRCAYGTDVLEPEALDELLAEVEAQAVELAGTLRRGELTPCPETCGRDGCRHPGICWAA
jgi:RecB family exonuclease